MTLSPTRGSPGRARLTFTESISKPLTGQVCKVLSTLSSAGRQGRTQVWMWQLSSAAGVKQYRWKKVHRSDWLTVNLGRQCIYSISEPSELLYNLYFPLNDFGKAKVVTVSLADPNEGERTEGN